VLIKGPPLKSGGRKGMRAKSSHSIVHALCARGHLRLFSFLPAVCLHLGRGLYVRCGAVLGRCGPMWSHFSPMGSDVVSSRTGVYVTGEWERDLEKCIALFDVYH